MAQHEIAQLKAFHAAHFTNQPVPEFNSQGSVSNHVNDTQPEETSAGDDDGLGYYDDGVKRTLTDEQTKMFRHSEIQRLLTERRLARQEAEAENDKSEGRKSSIRPSHEPRKWRSYDEPSKGAPAVDTLMYDEEPDTAPRETATDKKFLWPVLGQQDAQKIA